MKKLIVLMALAVTVTAVHAGPSIAFSEDSGGHWDYTASTPGVGTFSFVQPIAITTATDTLNGKMVHIPGLDVSNLVEVAPSIYTGDVVTSTSIQIKDGATVIMSGDLAPGAVLTVGSSASLYSISIDDIEVTELNAAYNSSAFIAALDVGSLVDFVLTLNRVGGSPLANMILAGENANDPENSDSRSLSGSMAIPEPATMALLALGGLLIRKRK
ncbi:MAG: PEP-CTERM sorting domain-containing protein [Planctomycetota bacterium]